MPRITIDWGEHFISFIAQLKRQTIKFSWKTYAKRSLTPRDDCSSKSGAQCKKIRMLIPS